MNNPCSSIFKTLLIIMFSCAMIAHHWSWDETCDVYGADGHDGGLSTDLDVVLNSDATGHSYTFGEGIEQTCEKDNNTDNRAYLAFYIISAVVAFFGICCLAGETGEAVYATLLILLFVWYVIMEGLRVQSIHSELLDLFEDGYGNDIVRLYLSFHVAQFCLYCSLLVGLALELFNLPSCHCACVRTVVVQRKAVIEV